MAPLAEHWDPMTWWGPWAPPFWRWVGRRWEKGWLGVWVCCLQPGEQSVEWLQTPQGGLLAGEICCQESPPLLLASHLWEQAVCRQSSVLGTNPWRWESPWEALHGLEEQHGVFQ